MKRMVMALIGAAMLCGCSASRVTGHGNTEEPTGNHSEADVSVPETQKKEADYHYTAEQVEPLNDRVMIEVEFDDISLYDRNTLVDRVVSGTVSDIKEWIVHEAKTDNGSQTDYYATTFTLHTSDTGEEISVMLPYSTRHFCNEWILPEEGQVYHAALKKSPSDKPQRGNPTAWLADYYVPFAHLLFSTETDEARLAMIHSFVDVVEITDREREEETEFTNNYELVSASQGKGERWWEINVVARALVPGENIANVSNGGSVTWYILDGEGNRVSVVDQYGEKVELSWPELEYHGIATSADSYAVMTMKVNMAEKYPEGNYTLVCNMDGEERKVDLNISYD